MSPFSVAMRNADFARLLIKFRVSISRTMTVLPRRFSKTLPYSSESAQARRQCRNSRQCRENSFFLIGKQARTHCADGKKRGAAVVMLAEIVNKIFRIVFGGNNNV